MAISWAWPAPTFHTRTEPVTALARQPRGGKSRPGGIDVVETEEGLTALVGWVWPAPAFLTGSEPVTGLARQFRGG